MLKIDERRQKILDRLRRDGRVYVSELCRDLGVTPVTVRNDLGALEKDGYLERMSGGAVHIDRGSRRGSTPTRNVNRFEAKKAIAEKVAGFIKDGNTIFINSGSTAMLVAEELKKLSHLNVVTNSLAVANALCDADTFRVTLLGGELNTKYGFTYGTDAEQKLGKYHADFAILSIDGIGANGGITTYHSEEAPIDRLMIEGGHEVIIAADGTKVGRAGFMRVSDELDGIHLVTGCDADKDELNALSALGVRVTVS